MKNTKNIIKNKKTPKRSMRKIAKSFWRRKRQKAKKVSRNTSISTWRLKVETTWVYEKLLFST